MLASVVPIFELDVPAICLVGTVLGPCAPVTRDAALATSGEALESVDVGAGVDVLMGAQRLYGLDVSEGVLMGAWLFFGLWVFVGVVIGERLLCGLRVFVDELIGARLLSLCVFVGVLRRRCKSWACALVFAVLVRAAGDFLSDGGWMFLLRQRSHEYFVFFVAHLVWHGFPQSGHIFTGRECIISLHTIQYMIVLTSVFVDIVTWMLLPAMSKR